MKVRFLESLAGVDFTFNKGDEKDIPDGLAKHYIKYKKCIAISDVLDGKPVAEIETAGLTKEDYREFLRLKGVKFHHKLGEVKLRELCTRHGMK